MDGQIKKLQKLEGIGEVLARRLIESGYDTIAKVAAAEKHELGRIAGMNPQKVQTILTQARRMVEGAQKVMKDAPRGQPTNYQKSKT